MTVCLVAAAFVVGAVLTYVINKTLLASRAKTIIEEAEKEAEVLTKNKLLEVKEEFLQRKAELEKQVNSRNSKLQSAEAKLKQRELNSTSSKAICSAAKMRPMPPVPITKDSWKP